MRDRSLVRKAPAPADRWIFFGLLALLVWLPLPWGSAPGPAISGLCLAVALLVLARLVLAARASFPKLPFAARFALGVGIVWLLWVALQLVPLPPSWLEVVSPLSYERHAALAGLPGTAALFTISVLPGATIDRLLLSFAYFGLFWLTLVSLARNRSRQFMLLLVVAISGLGQGLYAIVMTLSGWEYGFLEPKVYGQGSATGTFVNRNHLAGYLELTLSAGIALILADLRPHAAHGWRERLAAWVDLAMSRRMRIRVMMVVMVIALVLTQSRGGNIAFFSSLAVCGCVYMFLRHKQVFLRSLVFFLSLIAVDLLIVSDYFGLERVVDRIERTDWEAEQRKRVFEEVQPLVSDFGLTGSGLGTFAAVYLPHRSERVRGYIDHAHNDHLEYLVETGWIGYSLLALLAGTVLVHGLLTVLRRNDPKACALGFVGPMALSCLALHGLVDFNLQIPANAALLMALIAACLSCSSMSRPRSRPTADAAAA